MRNVFGDLAQRERNKIMADFKEGRLRILVSTDVSARELTWMTWTPYQLRCPTSSKYYTHRIGRTGRAKKQGKPTFSFWKRSGAAWRDAPPDRKHRNFCPF